MSRTASERKGECRTAINISTGLLAMVIFAVVVPAAQHEAKAQRTDRTGKEVVETVCAACHATGAEGAPKIGDVQRPKRDATGTMHGGIPSGKGYYHVNISLIDSETKGEITDAKVEVTVEDPVMRSETKTLELIAIDNRISYGNYFQMPGKDPYSIGVRVRRPGAMSPISTKFDFKPG